MRELRFAYTVENYDETVRFYRDVLGLPVIQEWDQPTGSGAILDAGRATLELLSVDQSELVDRVEVGETVSGPVRLALEVEDSEETASALASAGAQRSAGRWLRRGRTRTCGLRAPDGMQLTLFTVV